ncbi:MAG: sialidase [Acidobacteriales bacterium]|nr:sialidase [Terriglobales bacterium]
MLCRVLGRSVLALIFVSSALVAFAQTNPAPGASKPEPALFDSDTFSGLEARNLGPGVMSGRIAAVDAVVEKGRLTIYVGSATGGVWKSMNGGNTFKPVFDKYTQSIGAVTIDPSIPKTIWVGTGESWTRNSVSVGTGIYKSTDAGENWEKMGLPDSERISRVLVDPDHSDTVYACATGHLWNANSERGVFKTTDGGKTWNKVLFVNDDTGCGMIAMDPQEPNVLYAGMWQFRRKAYTFSSGGPGSGLFKSTDGGTTWKKLSKGLPEGDIGRIGIAIPASRPSVVYAVVEAKKSALFRSEDLGETWKEMSSNQNMVWRPFYFANIFADPKDYNRVYKPGGGLSVSDDGGKTFSGLAGNVHGDFHTLWINPANPDQMIVGDDGGLSVTEDRGSNWRFIGNLPVSQFYHVSYDMQQPYNVYGGLQDNSSWFGPSSKPGGVQNRSWTNVYGGDGFWVFEDTSDPDFIYAEAQGGYIGRVNRKTHEGRDIKPVPNAGEKKLRFNWNTPIHMSPNEKGTIYIGAQYLFRSRDHGDSWDRISPDLTTNDPEKQKQEESGGITVDNSAAEAHTTIYSISESPRNGQIIWVGTDDGNVQITRDGAKTWTNVVKNISGLPANAWVSTVEASRFDEGTAYATFDNHTVGDLKSYAYKTTDYGKSWQSLVADNAGVTGYAHVIKEDTVNKDLLFLGTEFGLFLSLDGGAHWAQFKGGNFPSVAVRDIAIHPRDSDLILATHGRGIWILDDITSLRALTPAVLAKDATFLSSKPAVQGISGSDNWVVADSDFNAREASDSAVITYYQKKRHIFGDLKLEIYDPTGKLVSTIAGSKRRGINRVEWSMRMKSPRVPPAATAAFAASQGPRLLPGTYTVKMLKNKDVFTTELKLIPDPLAKHTKEDRVLQFDTAMKIYNMLGKMTYTVDSMIAARAQSNAMATKLPASDPLRRRLEAFSTSIDELRSKIVATKEGGAITGEERIREQMAELYGSVNGYEGRPTKSQMERAVSLGKELDAVVTDFHALMKKDLPTVNAALDKKKLEGIKIQSEADWDKSNEKN